MARLDAFELIALNSLDSLDPTKKRLVIHVRSGCGHELELNQSNAI